MKKLVVLLVIVSMFLGACGDGLEYGAWKDTMEAFGNGNYQILHGYEGDEPIGNLHNCKHNQEVMTRVDNYVEKDNYVYFVGHFRKQKVFCKLNIETNLLSYYPEENGDEFFMAGIEKLIEDHQIELLSSFEDFSEEDRLEFERLTND